MLSLRKSSDRGHFDHGWLDTFHTFSFGRYYDDAHMGFRALRVINEDIVAPGRGFGEHPHSDMEIITYIISGALAHKDSTGSAGEIRPGDVQRMSAGRGIRHSEFNPSKTEPCHLLQIWIEPAKEGAPPSYEQKHFTEADRRGLLRLVASHDAADGSVKIGQDARLYASILAPGQRVDLTIASGRHAWVQVIKGGVTVNTTHMSAGDGLAVSNESTLTISAAADSELLVFDLA